MRAHPMPRRRDGVTLIELLLSMVIMLVVMGAAVSFFRVQARAAETGAGRQEALQSLRAVQSGIDRELRLAGGITGQPLIVFASATAIAFNVDLVTRTSGDPGAVYYNPDADSLAAGAWDPSRAQFLPGTARSYPTATYLDEGGNRSTAETVAYFLWPDASAARSDAYTLFRRGNDRDSTVVARHLIVPVDSAFFSYWRTNAAGALTAVPSASLPLYWDDAGGITDSLRVVDVRISSWYRGGRANHLSRCSRPYSSVCRGAGGRRCRRARRRRRSSRIRTVRRSPCTSNGRTRSRKTPASGTSRSTSSSAAPARAVTG